MTKATCLDALTSTSGANAATGIFVIFHRLPMLYVASVCISWFGGDEGYVNVLSFLLCWVSFSGGEVGHVIDLSSQQIRGSFSLFFLPSVQMYRVLTD